MVGAVPADSALPHGDRGACLCAGGRGLDAARILPVHDGDARVVPRRVAWPAAQQAIYLALGDFFAGEPGEFLVRNLQPYLVPKMHFASMFLLLFTANGIFEPLEVALNRAWGVAQNRSYVRNQLVSLGLIFLCGGLSVLSMMLTAAEQPLDHRRGRHA